MLEIRGLVSFIEQTSASIEAFKKKAADVTNEVVDIIKAVVKKARTIAIARLWWSVLEED